MEILENKPAAHPVMGNGVYTLKHYHIDRRFPGWLKAIAPKVSSVFARLAAKAAAHFLRFKNNVSLNARVYF